MSVRKRFIAGAICPACQALDALAVWRESGVDVVGCVKCGHQMRDVDEHRHEPVRKEGQVIGIFHLD